MSQVINETLNLNIASLPTPVPHTDGGEVINNIAAPNTGSAPDLGGVIGQMGPMGCSLVIISIAILIGAIVFFCFRKKFHDKTVANLLSCILFAFAIGVAIPSVYVVSNAINNRTHVTNIDVTLQNEQPITTVTDVELILGEAANYGYTVSAYMEGNDVAIHNKDNSLKINATNTVSAIDPANILLNSYGVKNFTNNTYGALSTDPNHPTVIIDTNKAAAAGSPIKINYATRLDNTIVNDQYTGKIVYTITPKISPWRDLTYMQEMTPELCAAEPTPLPGAVDVPTKELIDNRDGQHYTIAKYSDGHCWMTRNLNLMLSDQTTLTAANTNLVDTTEWTPSHSTITDLANWEDKNDSPRSYSHGEQYIYSSGSFDEDPVYSSLNACVTAGHSAESCEHYKVGVFYNWTAAKATNNSASQIDYATSSHDSICPKGWTLPAANAEPPAMVGTMLFKQGIVTSPTVTRVADSYTPGAFDKIRSQPLYWTRGGYVHHKTLDRQSQEGTYWSDTAYDADFGRHTYFTRDGISMRTATYKFYANNIRCVAL